MTTNPFDSAEFRKELGDMFDAKLQPITDLVAEHERTLQRSRGAFWILGVLWTAVVGFAEFLFHRKP